MLVASIRDSIDNGFTVFFAWVPRVLAFLAILIIGYLIAKAIGKLVFRATHRAGLDRTVHNQMGGNFVARAVPSPSRLLGTVAFWAFWLAAISLAVSVLGVDALKDFVAAVFAYLPNVLAALLIFLVAGAIAGAVVALVKRTMGDTALGKIVGTVAPILIMTIATFMILEQLKIAHDIVVTTYTLLLGAIALGLALAFGLGGREVAARMLEGAYARGQANTGQWRQDLQTGKERGREQMQQARDQVQQQDTSGDATRIAPQPGSTTIRIDDDPSR